MLIKNRWGRILEVPTELGQSMMRKGECAYVDQTPEATITRNELSCPYCDKVLENKEGLEEHTIICKKKAPLISIIIPSRVEEDIVSLLSLKKQTYDKIEIIVEKDTKKEGAPVCRNRGFRKSKGKFLLFSDNDLEWREDSIEVLYKTLKKKKKASYCYGSYTIDGALVGHREFDPIALKKSNYISTMALIRRGDFPGFDEKLERYQDWDLWLAMLKQGRVGVFCGECLFATSYRNGITLGDKESPKVRRDTIIKKHNLKNVKLADIVIPHQDRHDRLIEVLKKLDHDRFNIIVVSGGTFSGNCNKGARIAETDDIFLMNDDIEPKEEVIRAMLESPADICGAAQITPDWHPEKVYYGISYKWEDGTIKESITNRIEDVTIPTGFLLRVKKKIWQELGGFDESYKNGGEDQEIALRALELGYTLDIVKTPTLHHHSQSRDRFKHTPDNRALLNKRWPQERIKDILTNHKKQMLWLKD